MTAPVKLMGVPATCPWISQERPTPVPSQEASSISASTDPSAVTSRASATATSGPSAGPRRRTFSNRPQSVVDAMAGPSTVTPSRLSPSILAAEEIQKPQSMSMTTRSALTETGPARPASGKVRAVSSPPTVMAGFGSSCTCMEPPIVTGPPTRSAAATSIRPRKWDQSLNGGTTRPAKSRTVANTANMVRIRPTAHSFVHRPWSPGGPLCEKGIGLFRRALILRRFVESRPPARPS